MIMLPFGLLIPDLLINFGWQIFAPSPATILMRYYKENPLAAEESPLDNTSTINTTTNVVIKGTAASSSTSSLNRVIPDVSAQVMQGGGGPANTNS
jgi:hypothetical protein